MRLVHLLSFAVIVLALAACGPRQPAEAPSEPQAPAATPDAPAVPDAPVGLEPGVEPIEEVAQADEPDGGQRPRGPALLPELADVAPRSSQTDPEALVAEWHERIHEQDDEQYELRLKALGGVLANLGPDACEPLFEVMADESQDPMARYLVVMSLEDWVMPNFVPTLEPYVEPEQDELTRGFATHLIGRSAAYSAIPLLEGLATDSSPRVQLAAQLGLAAMEHGGYEEMLLEKFRAEFTSGDERAAIAFMFAERGDPMLTDFYLEAAADPSLMGAARGHCLEALSQIADPSTKPELQDIADNPELADQRDAAMYAIRQIDLRESGSFQPFPPIQ